MNNHSDGRTLPDLLRADWRFLLPTPATGSFRHLVLLGGPDGLDERLLNAGIAESVSRTRSTEKADAVVLLGGTATLKDIDLAASVLEPGGVLYAEFNRRQTSSILTTPAALYQRLKTVSLSPTGLYWPVPNLASYKRQIPLDVPGALPWYFATMFAPGTRAQQLLQSGLRRATTGIRTSRVARFIPWFAVTAIAGSNQGVAASVLGSSEFPLEFRKPGLRPFLLTSGIDDGSRVAMLPFSPSSRQPDLVVKAARVPDFNTNVEGEQRTLAELRSRLDASLQNTIPRPLGTFRFGDLAVGMESFASGRSMFSTNIDIGVSEGYKIESLQRAVQWLTRFHQQIQCLGENAGAEVFANRAATFFERFTRDFGATTTERQLFSNVLAGARDLVDLPFPLVWQHNDFGPWNVYRDGQDITVIDWEIGWGPGFDRVGLPLCDLLYFITYWSFSARRVFTPEGELRAIGDLFLSTRETDKLTEAARQVIDEYLAALKIDRRFIPLLLVYTWVERAVKRADRKRLLGMLGCEPRKDDRFVAYVSLLARHTPSLKP